MQRLFDVCKPAFDLGDYLDEVIDVESSAGRACDYRHSTFAKLERFQDLPRDADLFMRFGGKRNADRIADALVQQNTKTDRRFDGSSKRRAGLGDTEMKWIIDFLSHQAIGRDHAIYVGCLQGNYRVAKAKVFENAYVPHAALDHRFRRRRAVFLEQIFFKRTAVNADADRHLSRFSGTDNLADAIDRPDVSRVDSKFIYTGVECI